MRRFVYVLALVAMMFAPLAAPAAALAATPMATECAGMTMDMTGHDMPVSHHGAGEACCIAVPPAIDPPTIALHPSIMAEHLAFVVLIEPFRLGAGPKAEDPPPRAA
ncbi:MAG: hypothetical protein ABI617_05710 [Sphingomicrobium sp.]